VSYFIVTNKGKSVKIDLNRSPVNALNYDLLSELNIILDEIESNCDINILILSGGDSKFFSFGLDIPEILLLTRSQVKETLNLLVNTCKKIYLSSKITISKINGHATGGGCMLALSTDFRFMVNNRSKIALNEINIGLSLFSSTIEILKSIVGTKNAKEILLGGKLLNPSLAKDYGLVNDLYEENDDFLFEKLIDDYGSKSLIAIKDLKKSLQISNLSLLNDEDSKLDEFLDIFYSEETQEKLRKIKIKK
jgi:enoyl-CoA hydratase/carnithine racemase|tara:strand:+ start:77 stop:826 length:750 start_codon:yes stop_codon:yes gene_type:complete